MENNMVERVSRAIDSDAWLALDRGMVNAPYEARQVLLTRARWAIEAMREPTEAMCRALEFSEEPPVAEGTCKSIWAPAYRAMIDAALSTHET